ncbi:MAG TPA: STAS domain-containing protein [Phycisphaerales bacterium]|nr:STAS domain-containing protein [Phycisphaerales bacterium]
MAVDWSDNIVLAELADEPSLSDELADITQRLGATKTVPPHVVLNFSNVSYVGSSNIGALLAMRRVLNERKRRLVLCSVNDQVWSIFLVTGLDKIFTFAPDQLTALAGIQLEEATGP